MKRQASTAMAQASKSYGLMKQVSVLEDNLSGSVAEIMHLKECDSFLGEFIKSACEQLKCKFPVDISGVFAAFLVFFMGWLLACILLMKIIGLSNGLQLWRRSRKMRPLCGLTRGTVMMLYFCRIMLNTLVRLWMVVENL
jgi:hypothetical protein